MKRLIMLVVVAMLAPAAWGQRVVGDFKGDRKMQISQIEAIWGSYGYRNVQGNNTSAIMHSGNGGTDEVLLDIRLSECEAADRDCMAIDIRVSVSANDDAPAAAAKFPVIAASFNAAHSRNAVADDHGLVFRERYGWFGDDRTQAMAGNIEWLQQDIAAAQKLLNAKK